MRSSIAPVSVYILLRGPSEFGCMGAAAVRLLGNRAYQALPFSIPRSYSAGPCLFRRRANLISVC